MRRAIDLLSDVESDVQHLYHLVDISVETLIDVDLMEAASSTNQLHRLGALLWCMRDKLDGMAKALDDFPRRTVRAEQAGLKEGVDE